MFTLKKLKHQCNSGYDDGKKVVVIAGHVFCISADGTSVTSVDEHPVSYKQVAGLDGSLHITDLVSPLVSLLCYKDDPHRIFLVFSNGKVELWVFSLDNYSWSCHGNVMLSKTADEVEVTSAALHESQNALYWAECQVGVTAKMTLCTLALPKRFDEWSRWSEGAARVELMTDCPPCQLYPLADSLLVLPRSCSPPGVYLKWVPSQHSAEVHVRSVGLVISEKKHSHVLNCLQLFSQAAAAWQQAEPITDWRVLSDPVNRRILFISPEGDVYFLTDKVGMTFLVHLCHKQTWSKVEDCHLLFGFVVAVSRQDVRMYGLNDGELVQRLCVGVEPLLTSWSAHTSVSIAGICTAHAAYQLQLLPSNQWGAETQQKASCYLSQLQMSLPATLDALENVHNHIQTSPTKSVDANSASGLRLDLLQSPTLLCALLREGHDQGALSSSVQSHLRKQVSQHVGSTTHLQQLTEAFVNNYQRLEEQKQSELSSTKQVVKGHQLRDELHVLLMKMDWLPLDMRCSLLHILMDRSPTAVLDILLTDLAVIRTEMGCENELKKQLWAAILFPQTVTPGVDLSLLKIICQPCFKLKPQHLKPLVGSAIQECDKRTGAATFMDKRNRHLICFEISQSLPAVNQSVDSRSAAKVTAWLLLESGHSTSELEALQVLSDAGLWQDASALVSEQFTRGAAVHRPLFHLLLTSACKQQKLAPHIDHILEVAPPEISASDLLGHLQQFYTHHSACDKVFCDDASSGIRLGALQSFWTNQHVDDTASSSL